LLPRDGWEIVEEAGKRVAAIEIVNQACMGTLVPTNTGVPPRISGSV
jgi:hypothetical protein